MSNCLHGRFQSKVSVNRLQKNRREAHPEFKADSFMADIEIMCTECGEYFNFIGLNCGYDPCQPMVSIDGKEARMPIKPKDQLSALENL